VYSPALFEVALATDWRSTEVRVKLTFGITAPEVSATEPLRELFWLCANMADGMANSIKDRLIVLIFIENIVVSPLSRAVDAQPCSLNLM
jgi:hypothetical protein